MIVNEARNRQTGTVTQVVDNRDESFDVGGQQWISVCVDHGNYCEHTTRTLAFRFARSPLDWCAACQEGEQS